ncbi:MAG: GIY-YIG nuclease family protein [Bacillota bacterium]|jgi:hypothetical protein|nr:GIY-YIG nuclease family protein [Bacillota bacterium]HHT90361.1 GIY-YIG nuclease family protein [Bacillota bacterium]
MDRKKELKAEYRQIKPAMGVLAVRSRLSGKCYLEGAIDLKSAINRTLFQLKWGGHPNKELQRDWNDLGPENFEVEIVDELAYTEDQQDFRDDIAELQSIWQENLRQEETELY